MTDAVVSFLVENLSRLLEDELNLLAGVKDKVISLRNELRFINIFLKSSIDKRNDEFVQEVVNQIRDVAFKAEDVIDIYVANVAIQRSRSVLSKLFHFKQHVMVLHEVDAEIEMIKNRIQQIYNNRERYGITQGESTSEVVIAAAESLRERRRDVEEKDVVGLVHDTTQVIQQLRQGDSGRKVVSIIGMGGLGKTTLARKIYNNDQIKNFFPSCAWGYVSDDYRPRELWLSLLKCLLSKSEYDDLFKKKQDKDEDGADVISEEKLKIKVGECLKGKNYLVVLDDIWRSEVWKKIENAFPDDDESVGRILITSREMEVANYVGTTSPYYLPFLNKQESWELFSKKVFRGKECPSDLEPLGRSIAESCKGLPLTIVVLAGLVAKKVISHREWKRIKEITWHLTKDKIEAMEILKLSYDNLPQRLKPCFLYFGIYPEDYEINAKEVIQMWIAEWFIQPHEAGLPSATELEDIADYYLDELVDRSLVQVARRRSDGGVKTCRIHDLLRDLCISESKSFKFMEVCTKLNNLDTLSNASLRRLSIHDQVVLYASTNKLEQLCPRSIFFFFEKESNFRKDVLKSFKLARVLYFKLDYDLGRLPMEWTMMIHLRYLRVEGSYLSMSDSVSRLWNLETLDLKCKRVSSKIWMLKRLKHLYLRYVEKVPVPKSHRKIKANLETLWLLGERKAVKEVMSLLKNGVFPKLRKLVLQPSTTCRKELPGLEHFSNLQCLKVSDVPLPSSPLMFPLNLTKLTLEYLSSMWVVRNNLTRQLGGLTNLKILKLRRIHFKTAFDLSFGAGDFTQLQVFEMRNADVRSWRLEKGAMPSLRHLVINACSLLEELPEQLWSLTTLRQVHVLRPPKELADSLQNVELKNGCELIIS